MLNWKQNACWHQIQMRKKGQQPWFNFHLITKSNSTCELGYPIIICCSLCIWTMMPHAMFWSLQTFCEWQIHWMFPLSCIITLSFVFDRCPLGFAHQKRICFEHDFYMDNECSTSLQSSSPCNIVHEKWHFFPPTHPICDPLPWYHS